MLFGRQIILEVGFEGQQGLSFAESRIDFVVDLNLGRNANKATIAAYNLPDEAISIIQDRASFIRVKAGHEVPRLIFEGNPIKDGVAVEHELTGDIITSIDVQSGSRKIGLAHVNITFSTETTLQQVFEEVASIIELPLGNVPIFDDIRLTQGVTLTGKANDVLDRIATMGNLDWSTRNGALDLILKDGTTGEDAVLFSTQNGNLFDVVRKGGNKVEFTGLLDGRVRPGRPVVLRFDLDTSLNGTYKARDVTFVGSRYDNEFSIRATAVAL